MPSLKQQSNLLQIRGTGPQWAQAASDVQKTKEPGEEMRAAKLPFAAMFGVVHIHSKKEGPEISGIVPEEYPVLWN